MDCLTADAAIAALLLAWTYLLNSCFEKLFFTEMQDKNMYCSGFRLPM
jgi:hypothetical protein